jgi:Tfp pilus tip-associated adhesin PilY1
MKHILTVLFDLNQKLQTICMGLLAIFTMTFMVPVQAVFDPVNDDTDIFLANPNNPANRPNVLLLLDNTANWSRNVGGQAIFINEKSALVDVVGNLGDEFNIGLGMYTETGTGNSGDDGAYIRFGIRQMTLANRTVLANDVASLDQNADKGNNNTVALAMFEGYRYYAGKASRSSVEKAKTDFNGSTINAANALGNHPLNANTAGTLFNSPITDSCAQNFIIYISNGGANENASALGFSQTELSSLGYNTATPIALSPDGQEGNWMDEWADFMANADINGAADGTPHVYTYVIEVDPETTGQGNDMTALLQSVASKGKGKYFAVSSTNAGQGITNALNAIFKEIQAVNSVFASTTLPVSVNVRGTNLNQVYIGVFRPDERKSPRWFGNLKAYQLGFNTSTNVLFLADKNGTSAENLTTGFINPNAESFWTENSAFWGYRPAEQNGAGGASDLPDGDLVEKGGAAEQLRTDFASSQASRNLYTCTTGGSNPCIVGDSLSDTPFSTTNDAISDANLGLGTVGVSSLTALDTLPITTLSDTRTVTSLTTAVGGAPITNLSNNASAPVALTTLTTAPNITITAMSNNPVVKSFNSLNRTTAGGSCKIIAEAVINNHGYVSSSTVVHISGVSDTNYNYSGTVTVLDANTFTYTVPAANCLSNNPTITSATATTTSTLVTVTAPGHTFTAGNPVTIAGVTPASFNGNYNITSTGTPGADNFRFATASALPPVTSVAGATASSSTNTIALATTAGHTFSPGDSVTISGATPAGFNNTFTIISTNAPTNTTFTFDAGSALGTASTPGSVTKGGTFVTATSVGHGLLTNDIITISGAVPNGYNGSYTITRLDDDTFTYPKGGLPAWDNTFATQFSVGASTTVSATIAGHGFGLAGDTVSITVAGADDDLNTPSLDYNGSGISATVVDANTLTYTTQNAGTPAPATGTITARLTPSLGSAVAIGTITGHGFATNDVVTITGADIAEYNQPAGVAVTVIDNDTFQYLISDTGAPYGPTTGTVIAGIKTSTAHARVVAHGLSTNDTVTIAGATPAAFNGNFTVTVPPGDPDNFTYSIAPAEEGVASGTIVASTGAAAAVADDLVAWVRGADNREDENANTVFTDIRASVHGDVLHSRPAVVNYNRHGNDDDVYIFYGSNDGVFRAVKGGFAQSDAGEPLPGREAWGFIPEEFFTRLNRLRLNEPKISSSNKKEYFADGSLGVYVNDVNNDGKLVAADGDQVFIYLSMHRGGRLLYALDISDPQDPKLMWKKSNADWPELGQTWSVPQVVTIAASANPVLIFGAGYDPLVEDVVPSTITATSSTAVTAGAAVYTRAMGRGIFIVDAITGDLLFQAGPSVSDTGDDTYKEVTGMDCAIPADIAVITDRSGSIDNRAYVGDTCGNVWRLDIGLPDVADDTTDLATVIDILHDDSTITKLASIAGSAPAGLRKFLFPPDVVYDVGYDAVLIGSGDREHPFDETVVNRMYMFKDTGISTTPIRGTGSTQFVDKTIEEADLFDATTNCIQNAAACTGTGDETGSAFAMSQLNAKDGWFITLGTGEKLVGNAVTLNNITFFNTNQPSASSSLTCTSNLGIARQYQIVFNNATAYQDKNLDGSTTAADRSSIHPGGGYLPSPVPVVVEIDGNIYEGVLSGVKVDQPPGSALGARLRKFWFKEFE